MRRCKIAPSRCGQSNRPCCEACPVTTCQARCLNDPKRCGCWEDAPEPSPKKYSRRPGQEPRVDWDEVVRLYNEGLLQYQIALRLKCSGSNVNRILKEMGVTRRKTRDTGK